MPRRQVLSGITVRAREWTDSLLPSASTAYYCTAYEVGAEAAGSAKGRSYATKLPVVLPRAVQRY